MGVTLVDTDEAARHVGISASSLNKLRITGQGPVFYKIGRRVLYDIADLDIWLRSKRRSSTSDNGE